MTEIEQKTMKKKHISYEELEKANLSDYVLYSEKLKTIEWAQRREVILGRDKFTCQKCQTRHSRIIEDVAYINYTEEEEQKYIETFKVQIQNYQEIYGINQPISIPKKPLDQDYQPKYLQVHHKYYIKNNHPWNYPDEALISVCASCHQKIHDTEDIPVYSSELKDVKLTLTKCSRCNGSGHLKEYNYHLNGICFKCNGNEFEENI